MFHYLMLHYFNIARVAATPLNDALFDIVLFDVALFNVALSTVALFDVAIC